VRFERRGFDYALSKCVHPDTPTGDTTLQRELNDAHSLWADRN